MGFDDKNSICARSSLRPALTAPQARVAGKKGAELRVRDAAPIGGTGRERPCAAAKASTARAGRRRSRLRVRIPGTVVWNAAHLAYRQFHLFSPRPAFPGRNRGSPAEVSPNCTSKRRDSPVPRITRRPEIGLALSCNATGRFSPSLHPDPPSQRSQGRSFSPFCTLRIAVPPAETHASSEDSRNTCLTIPFV